MYPALISKTLAAASVNNIAQSQTPGAAGNLTLNGSAVAGGVATLDTQRQVLISQAADETGHTFTVYGATDSGAAISEAVAGSSGASVHTVQSFKTVTRVAISAAATGALQVGTNGVGAAPWKILDTAAQSPMNLGLAVIVSGTVNYTVNYCYDDPNSPVVATGPTAFSLSALAAKATTLDSNITFPVMAVQLQINSGTGTATLVVLEQGIDGP
jgi:hypothetical protein